MMSRANASAHVNGPQQGPGVTPQEHEFTERMCTICHDDIEQVMIATQKADTAFKMLLQVRNKVLEAYDEIKQMRV